MSDQSSSSASLPENPNLDWLRKQAKRRLDELRLTDPSARLADAQFDMAKQYGFSSWRALKAHIDSLTIDGQLIEAARSGDVGVLTTLLDKRPERLHLRQPPYGWTLLHLAAHNGRLAAVDLLLRRGLDVNTREQGDDTYAMHWAAAAGHLDVVRRLADAGGDVTGHGDDHQLEVIGWASCWDGCDDDAHHAIVDFLVSRGARHHIFSAIALNLADEVRRIVAHDAAALTTRMSRNENHQLPIHFAVRMNRPEMVALLLELGADPLATDGGGGTAALYAASPDVGLRVIEMLARRTGMDLFSTLVLGDEATANRLLQENHDSVNAGALHMIAKRGDVRGVKWLLDRGADPNVRRAHWDSEVTPLHLATLERHPDVVRVLLEAGANPHIRDTKHDSDAIGWAEFFHHADILRILYAHDAKK